MGFVLELLVSIPQGLPNPVVEKSSTDLGSGEIRAWSWQGATLGRPKHVGQEPQHQQPEGAETSAAPCQSTNTGFCTSAGTTLPGCLHGVAT